MRRLPSVAIAGLLLAAGPAALAAQCSDGTTPPCRTAAVQRPAAIRIAPGGALLLTATYDSVPLRLVIRELSTLVRRTIVASAAAETTMITAYVKDQQWDQALAAILRAKDLDAIEDRSGTITVRTNRERRSTVLVSVKRRASVISDLLRPTLANGVTVSVDSGGNQLVISGPPNLLDDAIGVLKTLDAAEVAAAPREPLYRGTTEELLVYAISQYEQRNTRGAIANLKNVTSPGWMQSVTAEQKVRAYLYLGASYIDLSENDSAQVFFMAALDFDPFLELRAGSIRDAARPVFEVARTKISALGVRSMPASWLIYPDSAATAFPFTVVTTTSAQLRIELVNANRPLERVVLLDEASTGVREVKWLGQLASELPTDSARTVRFVAEARFPSSRSRTETMCFTVARPRALQAGRRVVLQLKPYTGPC